FTTCQKPRPEFDGFVSVHPLTQFSESEIVLATAARNFAQTVIKPLVSEMDENSEMNKNIIRGCFENGFMGAEIGEEYGGPGASFFDVLLVAEELAKVDPSVATLVDVQNTLVTLLIIDYGTEYQKNKYLPRLHQDFVGSFCLSEANSGSDAFAMKTVAKRDNDEYVINGTKMWISNAEYADFFLFANAEPKKGYKGITAFLNKMGIRASSTCPIYFDNVRVPSTMVLGEVGTGYKLAMKCLNVGRIGIGAQMVGLAEGCYEQSIFHIQERKQFNKRIIDFQSVQHQIADLRTQIECARLLVYNASRLLQAGLPHIMEASMAKWFASVVANNTASKCVELLGGVGFSKQSPIEKFYRDAKIGTIYEGTTNINLNTIAKLVDMEYLKRQAKA
uniref:Short/branched chain specific acyl-CoA dehydrogenase, mitochondrial n=1 Tax=Syphacia muris TaxID=451379 RepID=A0A0N5AAS2_9BILA